MDSIHNLLKQLIIPYGDLSDESLKRVFKHFHVKELKKGEYFSKAGDLRQIVGIQFSGILRSYLVTDKGIEKTTDFSRKGDILTTIETEIPSIKWIQALNIPQYHIASYLGISPVSLSRLRAYR